MAPGKAFLAAAFASAALASPAAAPSPQVLDFAMVNAAPTVAAGPSANGVPDQIASINTDFSIASAATAQATATATAQAKRLRHKRQAGTPGYTPYYPALATGYTTDPALSATSTTTAGQPCVTQPEAGTYCGFINPLDPCAPQPDGYGPVPTPDTASAFLAYPPFHSLANAAPTSVPSTDNTQYTQVFKDLNAAVAGQSYLGLYSLKTYDVAGCGALCDKTKLCTAFNIFIERDPSLRPSTDDDAPTVWGNYCPNPPSMSTFKCTLWGSSISASRATNKGQYRDQFQVVITGSNGYDKTNVTTPPDCTAPTYPSSTSAPITTTTTTPTKPTTTPSKPTTTPTQPTSPACQWWNPFNPCIIIPKPPFPFPFPHPTPKPWPTTPAHPQPTSPAPPTWPHHPWGTPKKCGKKAIQAPKYHMGSKFFPGPFNPQVCSDYALFQNSFNLQAGVNQQCSMFNAYFVFKNEVSFGTYCNLFGLPLGIEFCTYGSIEFGNDFFDIESSFLYFLDI